MPSQPNASQAYTVSTGSASNESYLPFLSNRAPTSADTHGFLPGKQWVNETGNTVYVLTSTSTSGGTASATWTLLGTNTGALNTLTGDSGGAISPNAGNINVLGTANQVTTAGAGSTITYSLPSVLIAPGSLEVTSGFTVDAGAVTIATGTSAINISADAAATTVNLATGAGAKTLTMGSSNTTSTTTIACGTGGCSVGASANAHTTTVGSTTGAAATTVQSGSGALNITSTNGAQTHNSGTGAMGISTDAAATTISIGTGAGVKTITVGSTNTTSTTTLTAGSGAVNCATDFNLTAVATKISLNGGAVTDFIGQAVLVNGTVTVANTNIAAADRIFVTRSAKNGSTAYGTFVTGITAATSFTITSAKSDTTTETGDASTVDYIIFRQT